jgi:hypothetical protein
MVIYMEFVAVLIVLAVGLILERSRRADARARVIDYRRR